MRHGDRVLLHARNSNCVLETMFATWMIGGVWAIFLVIWNMKTVHMNFWLYWIIAVVAGILADTIIPLIIKAVR